MSSGSVNLTGQLQVSSNACGNMVSACGGTAGAQSRLPLALGGASIGGCGCNGSGKIYEKVIPPTQVEVLTQGSVGQNFVDIDILSDFSAIEFLYIETSNTVVIRLSASPAKVTGTGGTFPTGFVGAETLTFTVDGTAVSVAFTSGDQTAAQVAARINAACALLGLATPRAAVETSGQLSIDGVLTGAQGSVAITGGTGATTLGFAGTPSALGGGEDVRVSGLFLVEPDRNLLLSRVQVSGQANLLIVAAGQSA